MKSFSLLKCLYFSEFDKVAPTSTPAENSLFGACSVIILNFTSSSHRSEFRHTFKRFEWANGGYQKLNFKETHCFRKKGVELWAFGGNFCSCRIYVASYRAFVELHDFTDLILVQALRQFLWSFRLPGELTPSMPICTISAALPDRHGSASFCRIRIRT
jgi:hypothetical protein